MNVLYGLLQPDEGEILLDGEKVRDRLAAAGDEPGHRDGPPALHARPGHDRGREPGAGGRAAQRAAAGLQGGGGRAPASCPSASGSRSNPDAKVEDLGVGAQQRVEILRALFRGAKVLVLDEPTAVLTAQESQELFRVLRDAGGGRHVGRVHLAQAQRGARRLRPRDRAAAGREDRHGRDRGLDGAQPGAADGRAATCCCGWRSPSTRSGETLLRGARTCTASDDRGLPAVRDVSLRRARGRDRRPGRRRRQRAERADRGDHRAAQARRRAPSTVGGKDVTGCSVARDAGGRHRPHRRGPPPARPRARVQRWRRTCSCASTGAPASRRWAGCRRARWPSARSGLLKDYDVRGGDSETRAASLSGGNQQKVRDRARAVGRPAGADRRAADPRAGRGRDRVRPPPAGGGARRRAGRSCSSRSSWRRSGRWPTGCW